MFLQRTRNRNPALIRTAVELHQAGAIPPNTYVFDVDTFVRNAAVIRHEADSYGLHLYFMTKQHGRNPELYRRIVASGSKETVAVNMECARILHRHGLALGHIGNLVQPAVHELPKILATYQPEVITVFSVAKARQISEAADLLGMVQPILLRVHSRRDTLFPGMEGGFYVDEVPAVARTISGFGGVKIVGVTTFPVLAYDRAGIVPTPTPNLRALQEAREVLAQQGIAITQVNAPGNTAAITLPFLADAGVTHVEPGSALTGSSTFHLYQEDLPEEPALVYVTEVSHVWDQRIYVMGGGFFVDDPPVPERAAFVRKALVGADPDRVLEQELEWEGIGARGGGTFAAIDYHGILRTRGALPTVGDSVVFGFRPQLFMTRAYSAVVEGVASVHPRLVGLWDWAGHRVGGGME